VKNTVYIGIDPGQKGAIAFLDKDKKDKLWIIDMPLLPEKGIDAKTLYEILETKVTFYKDIYVVIEKAQSMPGQSSVAMFNYGGGYHAILAVLQILDIPFEEVRSNKWKTEFGLSGLKSKKKQGKKKEKMTSEEKKNAQKKRKEMAVKIAIQLFPKMKDSFFTPKGKMLDGRAEALLIAEYCKRKMGK